jgi:D-glycero-D-manno-heptose 1,7-bisphosphate phosphatase
MANSWMIGDKEADISAANAAGINNTILVKSGHSIDEANTQAKFILKSIKDSTQNIK